MNLIALFLSVAFAANVPISQLPLGVGSATVTNDSFPYVDSTNDVTRRLKLSDIINIPSIATPTFSGNVTAPNFLGGLTGTASGNTTYTANHYGVVLSGTANAMTVLAPNSSTAYPLVSGGASANPSWALLTVAGGGTGIASGTSGGVPYFSASTTVASSGALTASQVVLGGGAGSAPTSLAAGSQYQVLTMGAANPAYGAVNLAQSAAITGVLPLANGGLGTTAASANAAFNILSPMTTGGDLIYGGASGVGTRLANGTAGQRLISNGTTTAPSWATDQFYSDSGATQLRFIYGYVSGASGNCTSSTCTMNQTSGGFGTLTRNSTGNYTVNFSPSFSSAPACTCGADSNGALAGTDCGVESPGVSSVVIVVHNGANDGRFNIICVGPK